MTQILDRQPLRTLDKAMKLSKRIFKDRNYPNLVKSPQLYPEIAKGGEIGNTHISQCKVRYSWLRTKDINYTQHSMERDRVETYLKETASGSKPPLIYVVPSGDGKYDLVNGHHRLLTHKLLKIKRIRAKVYIPENGKRSNTPKRL